MASVPEMQSFGARLATFQQAYRLSKRRASSTSSKKKKDTTTAVEWPHEQPSVEELARVGFYYVPTTDSHDNVKCFLCTVKLDGWEPSDSPLHEHLAHASACAWATSLSVSQRDDSTEPEERDPMSSELVAARTATFGVGDGWVHEGKRGWRCKVSKLVEAGWCCDPSPDAEDGTTCFYCALSLDGWEPKDDPFVEHQRRSPDCAFFRLCEQYHGGKKSTGKGKGRASTASKTSRLSTQSAVSVAVSDAGGAQVDDSIMSTASQATVKGGKKKAGRPAKGAKGRKRANTVEEPQPAVTVPEVQPAEPVAVPRKSELPGAFPDSSILEVEPAPLPPTRATRGKVKQTDSSILEASQLDVPPKEATRGRKAKAQPEPSYEQRLSDVSAQLQDELEQSLGYHDAPENESTPQQPPANRGTKRTSEGMKKEQESSVVMGMEFPEPPQPAPKAKRGRKPSKQPVAAPEPAELEVEEVRDEQESGNWEVFAGSSQVSPKPAAAPEPEMEVEDEQPVKRTASKKKAPAKKGKGKGKKTSSARSSEATVIDEQHGFEPEVEDLARDEAEIEAELARMAAENAVASEHDKVDEFEASPMPDAPHAVDQHVWEEAQEVPVETNEEEPTVHQPTPSPALQKTAIATPSPSGSDKENQPSSSFTQQRPTTALKAPPPPFLSPTKTTRIPLAPGTPNRLLSPRKFLSPTKQAMKLSTTTPWQPVDLDTVLLASPQPTPGTLVTRLVQVSGGLTSPEKKMSVEEWVRWRAGEAERELRRKCEEMVGRFEGLGGVGVESLMGVKAV